jgi:hypothetical protein
MTRDDLPTSAGGGSAVVAARWRRGAAPATEADCGGSTGEGRGAEVVARAEEARSYEDR